MSDIKYTGELNIIKSYIKNKDIVFDVGGNLGDWSSSVLNYHHKANIHIFEPIPELYEELKNSFSHYKKVFTHNIAISDQDIYNNTKFYYYEDETGLSTLHRRISVEDKLNINKPEVLITSTISIDTFCQTNNISKIDFLKIDTEGSELNILKGAYNMLKSNKINNIQFEYGGAYLDANITLLDIITFMSEFNFKLYKIQPHDLIYITAITPRIENLIYCNFLLTNNDFGNNYDKI